MASRPSLAPAQKNRTKGGVGETFACPVAFLGWQNSILIPFCPVSWESLEEQGGPDTSREQLYPMVSREERKIGDARWVVDGRDRAEGRGGEGALGACLVLTRQRTAKGRDYSECPCLLEGQLGVG